MTDFKIKISDIRDPKKTQILRRADAIHGKNNPKASNGQIDTKEEIFESAKLLGYKPSKIDKTNLSKAEAFLKATLKIKIVESTKSDPELIKLKKIAQRLNVGQSYSFFYEGVDLKIVKNSFDDKLWVVPGEGLELLDQVSTNLLKLKDLKAQLVQLQKEKEDFLKEIKSIKSQAESMESNGEPLNIWDEKDFTPEILSKYAQKFTNLVEALSLLEKAKEFDSKRKNLEISINQALRERERLSAPSDKIFSTIEKVDQFINH